jgi:radical SAM superfamily enzyme YgiQ (UPF0313 family)
MSYPKPFEYVAPQTPAEAYEVLARLGDKAKILAGGTDLIILMKDKIVSPEYVVDITNIKEFEGIYAGAQDALKKEPEELIALKEAGLGIVYFGLESGSDAVLKLVRKGVTAADMIKACHRIKEAGLTLSITVISGLGGVDMTREHALRTAEVVSVINPDYLSTLTLMVVKGTKLYDQVQRGEFKLMTPLQDLKELKLMLEHVNLSNCVFRSNHASNYLPLKGVLNRDRDALVSLIERGLATPAMLRPEYLRGL